MDFNDVRQTAVGELEALMARIDRAEVSLFVETVERAGAVYVAGAGRSGLAMRAFAMRLMHLGMPVHAVGEVTAPAMQAGDVLVVGSGSGGTPTLLTVCEQAKRLGGSLALLTMNPRSAIGAIADVQVIIPAVPPRSGTSAPGSVPSRQAGAALFEQGLWILLDTSTLLLMDRRGLSAEAIFAKHANLE
jgi:6-phospho-3-hexuloisomerase